MFYKLIFKESDKRKKIDATTQTFEGLTAFAKKVFKIEDSDVGFLFLGQDDVSAYEISCDEDLEYVLEVTKTSSSDSKFIVIKVIENFESSPENPDKFSRLDESEMERKEVESFENLSSAIAQSKLEEEKEDLRNDLDNFDKEIIEKNEDRQMIESIDKMIEKTENVDMREFIEKSIQEEDQMDVLNEEMKNVELEEEIQETKEDEVEEVPQEKVVSDDDPKKEVVMMIGDKIEKKLKKKAIKKMKKNAKKKFKKKFKKKNIKKALKEDNIRELAAHLSESMINESGDKHMELESKIGDILNATLSQISKKFEDKQKKMEKKKDKKATKHYFRYCKKVKNKMNKFNKKMTKFYNDISEENRSDVPFDTIIWSNQSQGFNSIENEALKMEINSLNNQKFDQIEQINELANRNAELEAIVASLTEGKEVPVVNLPKKSSVSVETMHLNIVCDGCQTSNFKGRRYKCIVCPDFDLCETCEGQKIHSHPMLRLTTNNVNSRMLNRGLGFLRNRPRFQRMFNLPVENNDSSDDEQNRRRRRKKWWWMKKMFMGKNRWNKHCKRRSHSTSSSSSSDESNSPEHHKQNKMHHGHHHKRRHRGRRMWNKFANNMQNMGKMWMHKMAHQPWFIDFSKNNKFNKEMNQCPRPFPGFMGGEFKHKKNFCKKVKPVVCEKQKEEVKKEVTKQLENKTAKDIIPSELKKNLESMGVEIVDCYIEKKGESNIKPELGPNDIKIEVDILPPTEEKKEVDMMSEDKIIRKSSSKMIVKKEEDEVEDFKIECETPKKAMSSEEIEIEHRKEYARIMLNNSNMNEEVLHFFVINNLDLSREDFYKQMNEQKKFLSQC